MGLEIRAIQDDDQDALVDFFLSLSPETLTWQNHFGNPITTFDAERLAENLTAHPIWEKPYIAFEDGIIYALGWLGLGQKPEQRFTCTLGIVVWDKKQGKGIGKQLCEYMISEAKKLGMRKIFLNVYSKNFRALKMYDKLGFIEEGVFRKQEWTKDNLPLDLLSLALFL